MDRRRVVIAAAAVALLGGIVVLRVLGPDDVGAPHKPAPPTELKAYAADGVLIPGPQGRPRRPENVQIDVGHHRLKVRWQGDSPGYEVRWGSEVRLVTRPAIQLDGLADDREQRIEIRGVDEFGQRSEPAVAGGTPRADTTSYTFVDRFDGSLTPDPARWRLGERTDCARATPGDGDDHDRLVISSNCATNIVSLRSRTPFVRAEESRFVVETDAPNSGGQLLLDLVPGPVSVQTRNPAPGSVRLTVMTDAAGNSTAELFPDGTTQPFSPTPPGVSARWEVVVTSGGVRVEKDGFEVASSPFVPVWREATALVGVAALAGGRIRAGVDLIAFRAGAATTPPFVPPPTVFVDASGATPAVGRALTGVSAGQLRIALVAAQPQDPNLKLLVNNLELPLRPAVPDSVLQQGVEYLAVVDLPPEALTDPLRGTLRTTGRVQVTHADLELTPAPGSVPVPPSGTAGEPLSGQRTSLARPSVELLDAGGQPIGPGTAHVRGRSVIEVRIDSLAPAVSGLAGFDVRLDDVRIATIATTADGPGVAGRWRISLNTVALSPTAHTIEIRTFSTDSGTSTESAHVPFLLKP